MDCVKKKKLKISNGTESASNKHQKIEFKHQPCKGIALKLPNSSVLQKQPSLNFLKLNIDCFHRIFEWLSQTDIIAIGETCKRFQQIAGDYFQLNYAAKSARAENDGIYVSSLQSNIFSEFIQKISISGDKLKAYRFVGSNCTNSIKHFRVYGFLPDGAFEYVKDILKGVEVLEMNECFVKDEFFENYLRYCPSVKTLSVSRSGNIEDKSIIIGTNNEWLRRKYPSLKHMELAELFEVNANDLKIFFQQNPNILTISTDARSLWENQQSFIQSKLKLDVFSVNICQSKIFDFNNQPISIKDSVYNLLKEMHEKGLYQRLHLYLFFVDQQNLEKMVSLSALEMLNGDIHRIDRPLFTLNSLSVCYADEIMNIEKLPENLRNLKRVYFSNLTSTRILPFIRYSRKLKRIKIKKLIEGMFFRNGILDVRALNKEREKLNGAQKVTIYLREEIYLATKWTMKSIDFSLVELKRFESFEWKDLNARSRYFKSF